MRFFLSLFAIFVMVPVIASAGGGCWDAPCIPPVKCCICPCPGLIGAGSLDDPSKKDRNNLILEQPSEELALSDDDLKLQSEKALQALLSDSKDMSEPSLALR